ncbi:hypothetical protein [Bifidobacterium choloepi]|uniref:Uncharacterized protein n=1 Tax=Bifidobacterium choloepi TaxID=2614131 RepID=A0A6I5N9W1_9BIFI|nr:hypothetical protein [Bifidobacterium choloepi]NEG69290.1 hypothetical protein [Bifidobacterium choloepi]
MVTKDVQVGPLEVAIPTPFEVLNRMPDDPSDLLTLGCSTNQAMCLLRLQAIPAEYAMPVGNPGAVVDGVHGALEEDQGLISVGTATTKKGRQAVWSIVKTVGTGSPAPATADMEAEDAADVASAFPAGDPAAIDVDGLEHTAAMQGRLPRGAVQYCLTLHIYFKERVLGATMFADEAGVTGMRAATVHEYAVQKGMLSGNDDPAWSRDPYDASFTKGVPMNMSEMEQFDRAFPNHPLSIERATLHIMLQNN